MSSCRTVQGAGALPGAWIPLQGLRLLGLGLSLVPQELTCSALAVYLNLTCWPEAAMAADLLPTLSTRG